MTHDLMANSVDPRDALDFILFEHYRHRQMCRALEDLAASQRFEPEKLASMADFIRFDLTLHVIDEEEDFFPMLRARCSADDGIDVVLDRMTEEHAKDKAMSVRVRDVLSRCLIERKPPGEIEDGANVLRSFAQHEKHHMTLENAVVIPLARRRLTPADLVVLGERFAARRRRLAPAADG